MNKPNNSRRKASRRSIEAAFVRLLQQKPMDEITVSEICKLAEVNRSTFYANYLDIYDLVDNVQLTMEQMVLQDVYSAEAEDMGSHIHFVRLFRHIAENRVFYTTYFKLGLDARFQVMEYNLQLEAVGRQVPLSRELEYHVEFFRNGLNAIIKKWLNDGCPESPEEMAELIRSEYSTAQLSSRLDTLAKQPLPQ